MSSGKLNFSAFAQAIVIFGLTICFGAGTLVFVPVVGAVTPEKLDAALVMTAISALGLVIALLGALLLLSMEKR